jgi:hypothetical protein
MKKRRVNKSEDEEKINIIESFCEHLDKGFSEYSFVDSDYRDIEEYAKYLDEKNKNSLQVNKIKKSLRKSFLHWENIAFEMYEKNDKKHYFPLWIFYMKGRFLFGIAEKNKLDDKKKIIDVNLSLDNDIKEIEK